MRTLEDWESAASRVWHVVNDHSKTHWLHQDVLWLGMLDIKIRTAKTGGDAPLESLSEKIMHSKLWVLQAYEIIRALNEFDDYPTKLRIQKGGKTIKTGYFTDPKKLLTNVRIPLAKYQKPGSKQSSYVNIRVDKDKDIIFMLDSGEEIGYEALAQNVFDAFNEYVRPENK